MDSSADLMIQGGELIAFVQDRLSAGQKVRYLPFQGVSMLPMLRQKIDTVELSPLPDRLEKYDLPVYQYPNGKVVMHRVVEVRDDSYICRGDNTYSDERITDAMLIAKVTAFKRGDRRIEVTAPGYRLYARFWVAIYPIRRGILPVRRFVGRVLRKLGLRRNLK